MEQQNPQCEPTFLYETKSGFAFETSGQVIPIFDREAGSIGWYDFGFSSQCDSSIDKLYLPEPAMPLDGPSESYCQSEVHFLENFHRVPQENMPTISVSNDEISDATISFGSTTCFYVGTVVQDQIQWSRLCFNQRENLLIEHRTDGSPLLAGKEYLVSRSEQERTEASAADHVTHLESLTLSRENSGTKKFSMKVRELISFAPRTCSEYMGLSCGWLTSWSRYTRSVLPCLSSVITSPQIS
jgi:hypothetical protein